MDRIKKIKARLQKWNHIFCTGMVCETNAKRDAVIISVLVVLSAAFILGDRYLIEKKITQAEVSGVQDVKLLSEQEIFEEVVLVQEKIDTQAWKKYSSNWYGFEVGYPESWKSPASQAAPKASKWEYRFQFRRAALEEKDQYSGFDVIVYDLSKVKELSNTDEFPKIKAAELSDQPQCSNIEGHLIETGDYPAEEIYLPPTDDCFEPALFFSFTRDRYIYNMVPVLKADASVDNDPRVSINENFPEFLAAVSTASLTDIVRPKAVVTPPKPKITAPKPVSYKVDGAGRLVCTKSNDKPSKSTKTNKRHLDMECCLDPDETPNPWCYYPIEKYGKFLK